MEDKMIEFWKKRLEGGSNISAIFPGLSKAVLYFKS